MALYIMDFKSQNDLDFQPGDLNFYELLPVML